MKNVKVLKNQEAGQGVIRRAQRLKKIAILPYLK
jgi:hypothetical protein